MKTGRKVATAEEFSVAKGENLVANATNTVAMLSPEFLTTLHIYFLMVCGNKMVQSARRDRSNMINVPKSPA